MIVIVPMIAVGVVLFQLLDAADDSQAGLEAERRRRRVARNLYAERQREQAAPASRRSQKDVRARDGAQGRPADGGPRAARGARAADRGGADRAHRRRASGRSRPATTTGSPPPADAAGRRRRRLGRIIVSMTTAERYAGEVAAALDVDVRVDRDGACWRRRCRRGATRDPERARRRRHDRRRTSTARRSSRPRSRTRRPVIVRLLMPRAADASQTRRSS